MILINPWHTCAGGLLYLSCVCVCVCVCVSVTTLASTLFVSTVQLRYVRLLFRLLFDFQLVNF